MKTKKTSVQTEQTNDLNESLVTNHQGKDGKTPLKSKLVLIMFLGILVFGSLVYFLPMFLGNSNGLKAALTTANGVDTFNSAVVMTKGLGVQQLAAFSNGAVFNENVIMNDNLDVKGNLLLSGAMKLGNIDDNDCTALNSGLIRYNSTNNNLEFCDGAKKQWNIVINNNTPQSVPLLDCTNQNVGAIKYNSTSNNLEFCDGTTWNAIVTSNNNEAKMTISPAENLKMDVIDDTDDTKGSKSEVFTVTNNGTLASTGSLTTKLEGINFEITTDGCNGITLSPGGTCTVTVTPKAILTSNYTGTLTVTSKLSSSTSTSGGSGEAIFVEAKLGGAAKLTGCYKDSDNVYIDQANNIVWKRTNMFEGENNISQFSDNLDKTIKFNNPLLSSYSSKTLGYSNVDNKVQSFNQCFKTCKQGDDTGINYIWGKDDYGFSKIKVCSSYSSTGSGYYGYGIPFYLMSKLD